MPTRAKTPSQRYAAVPQSPRALQSGPRPPKNPASSPPPRNAQPVDTQHTPYADYSTHQAGRNAAAAGVATGAVGLAYGPYSYDPNQSRNAAMYTPARFSAAPSEVSMLDIPDERGQFVPNTTTVPQYSWDKDPEIDDALHNPDPVKDAKLDRGFTLFSARGWMNVGALFILLAGLVTLFAGYPIIVYYGKQNVPMNGFNLGGINGSGQVPDLPNMPMLVDKDTPDDVKTRTGFDGKKYNLVFSDEFETPGRSFYEGDDPFWTGVDFHYWPTGDLEWYDPSGATTEDGRLVLTLTEERYNDLNFKSGMIQSWNKLCFTTGYIEVSVSLPGRHDAPGLWPGAWTMGNLGRAGYGATTQGTWPFSYNTCDVGTFPNQTRLDGTPEAAATGSTSGGQISSQPGQRLSACTCPNAGAEHPGPNPATGRGAPEIDIIEAQIDVDVMRGEVSQSYQIAPYNWKYYIDNSSDATTIYDTEMTEYNSYSGGPLQQAVSAVTYVDNVNYADQGGFAAYGYEYWSDIDKVDDGYITWVSQGKESWKITSRTIGPDTTSEVSQRLIPEEPMYMILNLGISPGFQQQDYMHLEFPAKMYVDYVRVYQREGVKDGLTCDPPRRPTAQYIKDHPEAYGNPNRTTWAQAGYEFPRNSEYDGC